MYLPTTRAFDILLPASKGRLIVFTDKSSTDLEPIVRNIDSILLWLGTPSKFTVHLWLQHWPRIIKANEWPTRLNINGGFATPGMSEVFVYREEEYDRVIIHEIIHAMKWDWKMKEVPLPCWGVRGRLMPHLFEAWTELYAEWLWCGWNNVSWEVQMRWQQLQATQLLARKSVHWSEDTNIFAYYILKAALAPHISFLWLFGNGSLESERLYILCNLVTHNLNTLRSFASNISPCDLSLRMTINIAQK